MITLEIIQNRLSEALQQSGMTQTAIANALNIKPTQICSYIKGRKMPALDTFANLCRVLDISADYLLGLEDEKGSKIYNNFGIHNGNISF